VETMMDSGADSEVGTRLHDTLDGFVSRVQTSRPRRS
jgi:hypothetical protein